MRKTEKTRKHADNYRVSGIVFQPLVVETFGRWDAEAVNILKVMATHCAHRNTIPPAMEI